MNGFSKDKLWKYEVLWFAIFFAFAGIVAAAGYRAGKDSADRWYRKHVEEYLKCPK